MTILKEIAAMGNDARFMKTGCGTLALFKKYPQTSRYQGRDAFGR
jgi:hypothetical protein